MYTTSENETTKDSCRYFWLFCKLFIIICL